jgi:hypothetical protein
MVPWIPGEDRLSSSCVLEQPNARRELLPEAVLGKDKAQCLAACFLILPVENRACGFHRTRLST